MEGVTFTPGAADRIARAVRAIEAEARAGTLPRNGPGLDALAIAQCDGTASAGGDANGCDPTHPGTLLAWDEEGCAWVAFDDTVRLLPLNGETLVTDTLYPCVAAGVLSNGKLLLVAIVTGGSSDHFKKGKLDGTLSYGSSATLSIWDASSDTGDNITVYDWLLSSGQSIASGTQVTASYDLVSDRWYVTGAQCS